MNIVEARGLSKSFVSKKRGKRISVDAVKSIDLTVERGRIFGFLGPNGAGKSTTVRMLSTLLPVDRGEVTIAGFDLKRQPVEVRRRIGYVSQAGGTDRLGTARENLVLQAQLYGIPTREATRRADALIEDLEMTAFADRRADGYSGGQRRKLDLALGMIHAPSLLFLDEPTTGLDPLSRAQLWEHIRALRSAGTTVFLTTHYLDEADNLCDRLAIIDSGAIVAEGTPVELKRRLSGDVVTLRVNHSADSAVRAHEVLGAQSYVRDIDRIEDRLTFTVDNGEEALPSVLRCLDASSLSVVSIALSRPSLDDVFLKITGRSIKETAL